MWARRRHRCPALAKTAYILAFLQLSQPLPQQRLGEADEAANVRRLVAGRGIDDAGRNRIALEFAEQAHQLSRFDLLKHVVIEKPAEAHALHTRLYSCIDLIGDQGTFHRHPHALLRKLKVPVARRYRAAEAHATLLAQVMMAESNRDTAIANRAHEGLVELTGYNYAMGSQDWNGVMQAGLAVRPETNTLLRAVGWSGP